MQTMQDRITEKLTEALEPSYLQVINESHLHKGHAGDDGSGESHFSIAIKSCFLDDMAKVQKHQKIYSILSEEMKVIHALSIRVT